MTADNDDKCVHEIHLDCKDQKAKPDGKVWHEQRRYQHALEKRFQRKLITIDGQSEGGAYHERNGGAPWRHDQPVLKTGSKVRVRKGITKPTQGWSLWWKRQDCFVVKRRHCD